jgi:hypothetical protein
MQRLIQLPVLLLLAPMGFAACIGPLKQWGSETSLTTKAASFSARQLENERIAVLNAMVGLTLEGFSHLVSRSLSTTLERGEWPIKVVSAHETLSLINEAQLATEYQALVVGYVQTGILNRPVLEKIGRTLQANYVFQPTMATFTQTISGRFSFLGLRLFQTRVSVLRLTLRLWDTRSGRILWESSGEATLSAEDVREFRIPFEEIAQRLWSRMLHDLWSVKAERAEGQMGGLQDHSRLAA